MEKYCPRYKELSEILGDRCRPAARPYNTGQSSNELIASGSTESTMDDFSRENEAGPLTVHRVVPGGSKDATDKRAGKQKLISNIALGNPPRRSPVQVVAEEYLGKSLAIKKKEAQARLMIDFIK
ncbi:hypothetical protein MUCCIDRAFT_168028 [Mucor lusitanicus CBS 277.49]|uniref:Uncharacterized protein n=1 Tax=Mucor lusitanicus CBS 277.49 TaxID=747725 RepID=A0A168GNG3_MUCCL|nr:hypothetical protein MUCCIDRAFT_168028 [Mucor lusitanicus CBS 277.49]